MVTSAAHRSQLLNMRMCSAFYCVWWRRGAGCHTQQRGPVRIDPTYLLESGPVSRRPSVSVPQKCCSFIYFSFHFSMPLS